MIAYHGETDAVVRRLESDIVNGKTHAQVQDAMHRYGENKLTEKKKKTFLQRFLLQFKDVMIIILLAASLLSFGIAIYEKSPKEFFEPALILLIVVLNALLGVFQESKAEKALEALKNLSSPHARVIRDGSEKIIDASLLVPGDIILLEAGDYVPADARLLYSTALKCEESALTGESLPSEKNAEASFDVRVPLGDQANMVFMGCSVTNGTAKAVVTATGMGTEMGQIASLLQEDTDDTTPLQHKLSRLGKFLGIGALVICAVIFIIGLFDKLPVMDMLMTSVSLAVSAIPEGLPAIVTVVLSIGVQRMVKHNAIIRSLPAVETLGSASIICSDKTGTLTQNRMTLTTAYIDDEVSAEEVDRNCSTDVKRLLCFGTLCSDASVQVADDGTTEHIGDPTETAIVMAARQNGYDKAALNHSYPRLGEIPFDSDRKLMCTVNKINGNLIVIVKGAFDVIAQRCISGNLESAEKIANQMGAKALRVLAVAYKEIELLPKELTSENLENNLTFMGLVGMIDPPRPEAKEAVKLCREAGIKPVMITGDHVITASAIAKELGILSDGDTSITGRQLDEMSDEELGDKIEKISVYARVSPENKIRIVKAWQKKDEVVAMTGDGVNDAPALKAADIGCAMGITGTDVAKGAADMTLTDDNFATIVEAVKEGRGIYANIKKVVNFLLGTNIGEVLTVFFAMLIWKQSPLISIQLLWINLVTDSFPAIALGMEAVEKDIMKNKPTKKNESIFAGGMGIRIALQGVMFALLTLLSYYLGLKVTQDASAAQTMAFIVLALCQVVQSFNMRSEHSLFKVGPFSNHTLNWAALLSVVLVALVVFTPVSVVFQLVYLTPKMYMAALGISFVPLAVMELYKFIISLMRKNKTAEK